MGTLTLGALALQTTALPDLQSVINPHRAPSSMAVADAAPAADPGPPPEAAAYWLASADGGIFSFGAAPYVGGPPGRSLRAPLVAMAATPSGQGYWVIGADGGVFTYGDAQYEGSTGGLVLNRKVVGIAPTPSGNGYWLVASDGGVFAFGDAGYYGSTGGMHLTQRIVGMAASPSGKGYLLVGADGGVFAFGDANYYGSAATSALNQPVVGVTVTASGKGYWLAAADGGIFSFGDAAFFGSVGRQQLRGIVGMAPTVSGSGYWLVARDGGVFAFGDADFYGSVADLHLNAPMVGIAARRVMVGNAGTTRRDPKPPSTAGPLGYDISWPQCGQPLPAAPYAYGIVGATGGRALSGNPCLATEWQWAKASGRAGVYMNISYPGSDQWSATAYGLAGSCAPGDLGCQLYNFGANSAAGAVTYARQSGVSADMWWLDVETANPWPGDTGANTRVVAGAIDQLRELGLKVGIYSTPYQWSTIVGGFQPGLPVWTAGASGVGSVGSYCDDRGFGGGTPYLVQLLPAAYDADYLCPPGVADLRNTFT